MDYNNLEDNTSKIISNLQILNENITLLKKKIIIINDINSKLEKNRILKQDVDNNLCFQSIMLKNELLYYTNIYNIILNKYFKELSDLSQYILIILISLNKLEIDNTEKKKKIYNKIVFTRKSIKKNSGDLNELFKNIINNLKVVDDYIKLFNYYINNLKSQNNDKNLHNTNFEINIKYKKDIITVEYNKHCDKFMKTINYFMTCSKCVIDQIETSKLLKFFLKLKLKLKDNAEKIL
jgi:hypothetical protein